MGVYQKLHDPIALFIFTLTLFLPIIIGFFVMRKTKTQSDFLIGGRKMDRLVVALSAVSSGRSSWLVLAASGMAYKMGAAAVWAIVGYVVVEMIQFFYVGRRLREQTETFASLTLLDYFETKYNDHHHLIRIIGALIISIFTIAYVGAQFNAGAKSLSTALGIPFIVCLIIAGVLILIYMVLGGFIAVAYNDVFRAFIMLAGLVLLPLIALIKLGGLDILFSTLAQLNPSFVDPFSLGMGAIIGFLGIGLGSPGQPHIVVRYMSIENPNQLRDAAVIGTVWNVILGWGAIFVGLLGRAMIPEIKSLPDGDSEMIYLVMSSTLFGPVMYGLLIGGIFAAILSTADSQLLVVASTFVRDIYEKILKKNETILENEKVIISRWVVIIAGLMSMILAYFAKDMIFWLVLFAWGGLGASFGPTLILSLYWNKTSKYGIVAGFLTGTLVTIIWKLYFKLSTGIYELIPAFLFSTLAVIVVSLILREKGQSIIDRAKNRVI